VAVAAVKIALGALAGLVAGYAAAGYVRRNVGRFMWWLFTMDQR
jgi:hypothetical protein